MPTPTFDELKNYYAAIQRKDELRCEQAIGRDAPAAPRPCRWGRLTARSRSAGSRPVPTSRECWAR